MLRRPAAAGGAFRRPAARLRRPAADEEEAGEGAGEEDRRAVGSVVERYQKGEFVEVVHLPPGTFARGDWLESTDAVYYQQKISVAAKVEREELDSEERELRCELTGTRSEDLLKYGTSQKPCQVRLHLCRPTCSQLRENPDLIHLKNVRKISVESAKGWQSNLLEEVDTLMLQADQAEWERREAEKKKEKESKERSSSSRSRKRKKKKKEKAKKKKKEEVGAGPPEQVRIGGKAAARKTLSALYEGTGLDPKVRHRKKLSRKVRKALKKNKETSSTGTSTSSTSSSDLGEALLEDRSKVHRIASLGPGLLAAQSVMQMKQYLTQITGTGWEADENALPPILSLYMRTYMSTRLTGGVAREFATLAWVGDLLLQARPSEALDGILQRMKSIELTASGTSWTTSQKLELVPPPEAQIGTRQEYQIAKREAKLDGEVKGGTLSIDKGKGKTKEKGSKGKEKGKGKNKEADKKQT